MVHSIVGMSSSRVSIQRRSRMNVVKAKHAQDVGPPSLQSPGRERVVPLLPNPTGLPLSSLSTACIRRRRSSTPGQRNACSSTPCAPARHRRPAPRLSARPPPKARLLLHPVPTRAAPPSCTRQSAGPCPGSRRGADATACPCHLASPRQHPKHVFPPPPRHWGSTCDRLAARHGRALACTVPTQWTPPRLPPGGRARPRRQKLHTLAFFQKRARETDNFGMEEIESECIECRSPTPSHLFSVIPNGPVSSDGFCVGDASPSRSRTMSGQMEMQVQHGKEASRFR